MKTITTITILILSINMLLGQLDFNCKMQKPSAGDVSPRTPLCNNIYTPFELNHNDDLIPVNATRHLNVMTNVVFVQNDQGEGNFDVDNQEHMAVWNSIFDEINGTLLNLQEDACGCNVVPSSYGSVNIQFVPNFIEIQSTALFDHNQDPTAASCPGSPGCNSGNKPYLMDINAVVEATPGYIEGFNWIVTSDGPDFDIITENIQNNGPAIWNWTRHYQGWWYSGWPVYDLDHPAMWHCPDLYLMYLVNENYNWNGFIENEFIPWTAMAGMHEYGHYFNLGHAGNCNDNIMNPSSSTRQTFNGCQIREMYETLMTKNLRKYVVCEDVIDHHITVDNNEIWTNNVKVYNDIVIANGGTLTVRCTLDLQPNTNIFVERGGQLIVNGGLITSCGEWNGITVEGLSGDANNETGIAGKVILTGDAIIENAKIGIQMGRAPGLPWSNQFWGGYVAADNSTIRNCRRGAAFMRHAINANTASEDRSFFNNVTFENIRDSGVTIWASDGIDFIECDFIDVGNGTIDSEGILVWSAAIVADENKFIGCEVGITLTSPEMAIRNGSVINTNTFRCEEEGVAILDALVFDRQQIFDNHFINGTTGIYVDGPSQLSIQHNNFDGQNEEGIYILEGGNAPNIIDDNEFNDNIRGICFNDNNNLATFSKNCFSGTFISDVEVVDGDIFFMQGDAAIEAGNVYTKNGIPEIRNQGSGINYFVWEDRPLGAGQRTEVSTNVIEMDALSPNDATSCGSTLSELLPDEDCSFRLFTVDEILESIALLDEFIQNQDSGDENILMANNIRNQRVFDLISAILGDATFLNPNYDISFLLNYLKGRNDYFSQALAISIYLQKGENVKARQNLNAISSGIENIAEYKIILNAMVDFLENGQAGVSQNELSAVFEIAQDYSKMGSKARSAYYTMTGQRIRLAKKYASLELNERSRKVTNHPVIRCFPNPNLKGGQLTISNNAEEEMILDFRIVGLDGIVVQEGSLESKELEHISTETFPIGLYILNVTNSTGELIHVQTLTILD